MRPCQQCNGPIGNAEKVCPACGAAQHATVGFQKASPVPHQRTEDPLAESRCELENGLDDFDFDPPLAASLCGIGAMTLVSLVALAHPLAATLLFAGCAVVALLLVSVVGGGLS